MWGTVFIIIEGFVLMCLIVIQVKLVKRIKGLEAEVKNMVKFEKGSDG